MQHAWAYEQQLTLSCRYHSLRAHLKLMLCFDIPLQSTNIKRETTLSVEHRERNGERGERSREMEAKWERRRRDRGGGGSETETGWRESGLTSALFMPLREQGLSLCLVRLFNTDRGWDRGGGWFVLEGWSDRMCSSKKKPCLLSSYSDTIKQLGEGCSQSLIILLQRAVPFGGWYHETALYTGHHTTPRDV